MESPGVETRGRYPHRVSIPTRWMDGYPCGRVNKAQYYSYVNTAATRMLYAKRILGVPESKSIA